LLVAWRRHDASGAYRPIPKDGADAGRAGTTTSGHNPDWAHTPISLEGYLLVVQDTLNRAFEDAEKALAAFRRDGDTFVEIERCARLIVDAFRGEGRVYACGNGGSMADAMHFAEEFTGRFHLDRRPYPALALGDRTHLTCVANDYGFEYVFSRQIEAFGQDGDVLIVLSTSGNSPNMLRAAEAAHKRGMKVVGFLGNAGGEVRALCDVVIIPSGADSARVQELHMLTLHAVIEAVEKELGHAGS
jgi:D-sedoheptulose 7-phosphate isomerase